MAIDPIRLIASAIIVMQSRRWWIILVATVVTTAMMQFLMVALGAGRAMGDALPLHVLAGFIQASAIFGLRGLIWPVKSGSHNNSG